MHDAVEVCDCLDGDPVRRFGETTATKVRGELVGFAVPSGAGAQFDRVPEGEP